MPDPAIEAIRARELAVLRRLIEDKPRANAMTECERAAWLPGQFG
jgi:hypothetical protein